MYLGASARQRSSIEGTYREAVEALETDWMRPARRRPENRLGATASVPPQHLQSAHPKMKAGR